MSAPTTAADAPAAYKELPTNIGRLLLLTFDPLDVFGPLGVHWILTWKHKLNLYLISDTPEPVSAKPLVQLEHYNPHGSAFEARLLPTHTLATAPADIQVLIVPGGMGTMSPEHAKEVDFIRKTYPKIKYLITICNGAGVLDGKRATTSKAV